MAVCGDPVRVMASESIALNIGSAFVLSSNTGDIQPHTPQGFYAYDTRFLSSFRLTIQGRGLSPVGAARFDSSLASFYATTRGARGIPDSTLGVARDRHVSPGLHEDITLVNHHTSAVSLRIVLAFDADFADVFEVRGGHVRRARRVSVEDQGGRRLVLRYRRGDFQRETWISFSAEPQIERKTAVFEITLEPKESWRTCVEVQPAQDAPIPPMECVQRALGEPFGAYRRTGELPTHVFRRNEPAEPLEESPRLETEHAGMLRAYDQCLADLRALRLERNGDYSLAAGLPWFMATFGRDSIISAIQTKLLGPELMVGTLNILASLQAGEVDRFRDAEPGKIPHEVRYGELSVMEQVPHSRYYGTVDATPLFLVLLWETYQWTGDLDLVRRLLPAAELALQWIDHYGDRDGDGFVEYRRKTGKGLRNQCWKDSGDSIAFADGALAEPPIAVAEVQGYVYAAKSKMADLYGLLDDGATAQRLEAEAQALRERFNEAFWLPQEDFYALALDGEKRQVDGIASNAGHLLWSGIVDPEKARLVVNRLMSPDMFSGWGIRTLSTQMARFNPLSYHNGSVWPHDTSLIAAGMMRYGFTVEAREVILSLFEAIEAFPDQRPPELFAGFPRREESVPMPYPAANAPQAWASGAVVYMIETLLGLTPAGERLMLEAQTNGVPLSISGVRYRGQRLGL